MVSWSTEGTSEGEYRSAQKELTWVIAVIGSNEGICNVPSTRFKTKSQGGRIKGKSVELSPD